MKNEGLGVFTQNCLTLSRKISYHDILWLSRRPAWLHLSNQVGLQSESADERVIPSGVLHSVRKIGPSTAHWLYGYWQTRRQPIPLKPTTLALDPLDRFSRSVIRSIDEPVFPFRIFVHCACKVEWALKFHVS